MEREQHPLYEVERGYGGEVTNLYIIPKKYVLVILVGRMDKSTRICR